MESEIGSTVSALVLAKEESVSRRTLNTDRVGASWQIARALIGN